MTRSQRAGGGMSRRGFLQTTGGLAAGGSLLGLSGCGGYTGDSSSTLIKIPDAKTKLPTGNVTFRLMDSNDTKAPYWEQFFAAYQEKHSNIECKYDGLPWERIEEVAPLGIRNGTAHDILQLPPATIPLPLAVEKGWVAALDDIIPDFQAWKDRFPEGTFAEGVQVFDGKTYGLPLASERRQQAMLHFNSELLNKAGYDPSAKPLTWDEFRAAAKKVTKQGGGQAYGLVLAIGDTARLEMVVRFLARAAGAKNATPLHDIDLHKGEYFYDQDVVAEAAELLLALKSDGSIFPGSSSAVAPEAWPRVVRGNAGMVFGGPWVAVSWEKENEDFEFGVGSHPVPEQGAQPTGYPVFGTDGVSVFSGSKLTAVAGDVIDYVTSLEGQTAWGKIVGVGNPPILDEARQKSKSSLSPQAKKCLELGEQMVVNPEPVIRNPNVAVVQQEEKPPSPDFGEVLQAALVGEITDIRKALRDLKDRAEKRFDEAIAAANKQGAKVSRDDYVFPNFDPHKDYTTADYKEL